MAAAKDLGPLDWKTPIVDGSGRPSPEFQRRWNTQRGNNGLIGFVTTGSGAPTGTPADGQEYVDISATPWALYVGNNGSWTRVGVFDFTQLADVPHAYTGEGGSVVRVNAGETGLDFVTLTGLLDTISSTEGSVLYRGPTAWAALAPGTAGDVLSTNGAGAAPTWVPQSGGGGGGDVTKVASVTTSGSQTTVTFSSIPGSYSSLLVTAHGRSTDSGNPSNRIWMSINGDGGNNYNCTYMFSYSGGVASNSFSGSTAVIVGYFTSVGGATNVPGSFSTRLIGYADTTFDKAVISQWYQSNNSSTPIQGTTAGAWFNTSAVTSITFTPIDDSGTHHAFVDGSVFTLYGLS